MEIGFGIDTEKERTWLEERTKHSPRTNEVKYATARTESKPHPCGQNAAM